MCGHHQAIVRVSSMSGRGQYSYVSTTHIATPIRSLHHHRLSMPKEQCSLNTVSVAHTTTPTFLNVAQQAQEQHQTSPTCHPSHILPRPPLSRRHNKLRNSTKSVQHATPLTYHQTHLSKRHNNKLRNSIKRVQRVIPLSYHHTHPHTLTRAQQAEEQHQKSPTPHPSFIPPPPHLKEAEQAQEQQQKSPT